MPLKFLYDKPALNMIGKIEEVFSKLPHLPKEWREFLVKITPVLALIGGVLMIIAGLSTFGARRGLSVLGEVLPYFSHINPLYFVISGVISILSGALLLLAFSSLQARLLKGWVYLFWSSMLSLAQSLLSIVFSYGSIVSTIISVLISLYILFEVKPLYKDGAKA